MVTSVEHRAERHAALGDPIRLGIVDELTASDRSPLELARRLGLESNLLAHHLDVLERVGLVERHRSSGDGRRRYVHLVTGALDDLEDVELRPIGSATFLCTANSARSQLAAALWRAITGARATSAGTHPADAVHPGAIAAARRHALDLGAASPRPVVARDLRSTLVVTVCDRAHEELEPGDDWLHWSVPDPVADPTAAAFDHVTGELRDRIQRLIGTSSAA